MTYLTINNAYPSLVPSNSVTIHVNPDNFWSALTSQSMSTLKLLRALNAPSFPNRPKRLPCSTTSMKYSTSDSSYAVVVQPSSKCDSAISIFKQDAWLIQLHLYQYSYARCAKNFPRVRSTARIPYIYECSM